MKGIHALTALALLLASSVVYADTTAGAISGSESTANSNSAAQAVSRGGGAHQGQSQGQSQGMQQGQDASNSNIVAPNQQITFNNQTPAETNANIRYSGSTTQRFAPSVVGGVLNPTTPCVSSHQVGGSGIGFGFNIGTTVEDKACTRREFARILHLVGQVDAGMAVLCGDEMVAKAAPAMCKKVMTAMGSVDMLPAVANADTATVATVQTSGAAMTPTATAGVGPKVGQQEKGSDGKTYRFTGQGWQQIANEPKPVAEPEKKAEAEVEKKAALEADVKTYPLARNVYEGREVVVQAVSKR